MCWLSRSWTRTSEDGIGSGTEWYRPAAAMGTGWQRPRALRADTGRAVMVEVFLDRPWRARWPVNDDEIIEQAVAVGETTGREVLRAAAASRFQVRRPGADYRARR